MTANRTRALRRIALVAIIRFYQEHRDEFDQDIAHLREDLIVCFMKGFSVQECFGVCTGFKSETESFFGKVRIGKGRRSSRIKRSQKWLQSYK